MLLSLLQGNKQLPSPGSPIGLLVGTGDFPELIADAVIRMSYPLTVVAVERNEPDVLRQKARRFESISLSDGLRALEILKEEKVRHVCLAGGISKKKIYRGDFPKDDFTANFLANSPRKGDDGLMRMVRRVLAVNGIRVLRPAVFLTDSITPSGPLTDQRPTPAQEADIRFGLKIAKTIGRLDIGQTLVVKDKTVLAVEALEGTDRTIERVGNLGVVGSVVVKVSKPQQDLGLDMPVVGPRTIECACRARCAVLAMEAGRTLFLHRETSIGKAQAAGLSIVGV